MRLTKQYAYGLLRSIPAEEAFAVYDELVRVTKILEQFPEYIGLIEFHPNEFNTVRTILDGNVDHIVVNFLEVLADDGLLGRLETAIEDYRLALIEENLLFEVKVYSVRPLNETNQNQILNMIESRWGTNFVTDFKVSKEMLGGIKLEVNGAVIDTTFRSRIDQIIREVQHGGKR